MPKFNPEQQFSRKSYYFGIMGLVLFLVLAVLQWTNKTAENPLPQILNTLAAVLLFLINSLCVYNAVRSLSELNSPKKIAGIILAVLSIGFLFQIIYNVF